MQAAGLGPDDRPVHPPADLAALQRGTIRCEDGMTIYGRIMTSNP
jgi:hypothetical protein